MANNNGHKSGGFGWFNPDDRLKQIINDIASKKDLKSLRATFLLLLEHPEVKPKLLERYGEQAYKEIFDKYNVTTKMEAEIYSKKADKHKKAKIEALKVLGFSSEDAEKLSELSSEDLKALAYIKQNTPSQRIEQPQEKSRRQVEIENLKRSIELGEKMLADPNCAMRDQVEKTLAENKARLKALNGV